MEFVEKDSKSSFDMIHRTIYELLMYRKKQKFLVTIAREAESLKNSNVCESMKIIDKSIIGYIEAKLKKGIEKGIVRQCNAKGVAFLLYKLYFALAFEWEEDNDPLDEEAIAENVSLFFKTGLLLK
ncbi:hypothetical protein D3C76_1503210 [compost metagenome]